MIGVGLVLPLMMFRWKEVGISPASLGMVGSIYSGSQLVGGLILGKLGDRGLGRKRTLLLSFAGAGVSYALVGLANSVEILVLSRSGHFELCANYSALALWEHHLAHTKPNLHGAQSRADLRERRFRRWRAGGRSDA